MFLLKRIQYFATATEENIHRTQQNLQAYDASFSGVCVKSKAFGITGLSQVATEGLC